MFLVKNDRNKNGFVWYESITIIYMFYNLKRNYIKDLSKFLYLTNANKIKLTYCWIVMNLSSKIFTIFLDCNNNKLRTYIFVFYIYMSFFARVNPSNGCYSNYTFMSNSSITIVFRITIIRDQNIFKIGSFISSFSNANSFQFILLWKGCLWFYQHLWNKQQ